MEELDSLLEDRSTFKEIKSITKKPEEKPRSRNKTAVFKFTANTNISKVTQDQIKLYEDLMNELFKNDTYYLIQETKDSIPSNRLGLIDPEAILKMEVEICHEIGTIKTRLHSHGTIALLLKDGYKAHINLQLINKVLSEIRQKVFEEKTAKKIYFNVKASSNEEYQWKQYCEK